MTNSAPKATEKTQMAPTSVTRMPLFPRPPTISGENLEEFVSFYQELRASLQPANFLQEMNVRTIADINWEIHRLRRLAAASYAVIEPRAMEKLFAAARDVQIGSQEWKDLRSKLDTQPHMNLDMLNAACMLEQSAYFEAIDRRLTALEARQANAIGGYYRLKSWDVENSETVPVLPAPPVASRDPE